MPTYTLNIDRDLVMNSRLRRFRVSAISLPHASPQPQRAVVEVPGLPPWTRTQTTPAMGPYDQYGHWNLARKRTAKMLQATSGHQIPVKIQHPPGTTARNIPQKPATGRGTWVVRYDQTAIIITTNYP